MQVTVYRLLEYTGEATLVQKTLARGGVPANGEVQHALTIKSVTLEQTDALVAGFKKAVLKASEVGIYGLPVIQDQDVMPVYAPYEK